MGTNRDVDEKDSYRLLAIAASSNLVNFLSSSVDLRQMINGYLFIIIAVFSYLLDKSMRLFMSFFLYLLQVLTMIFLNHIKIEFQEGPVLL